MDIENTTFKFNIGQFITNIKLSNWNTILNLKDTETTYDCLHDIISKHYRDALSPKINNKSNYKNRLPWLTHTLKNLIKQKNALYIKAKKSNTEENKKEYKQCKRRLNKEMKQTKRLYYNNKITENLSDPAKYWSIITEIIDKRKTKENATYFVDDLGQRNEDCLEISTNFNKYFTNVGPKLASNIPTTQKDFSSYLHHRDPSTIFLEPGTIEETMKTIIALKDASAGWDSINKYMLINILDSILVPLTHILNCSIIQGVFPSKLKIAKIKPIYKADNKHSIPGA